MIYEVTVTRTFTEFVQASSTKEAKKQIYALDWSDIPQTTDIVVEEADPETQIEVAEWFKK